MTTLILTVQVIEAARRGDGRRKIMIGGKVIEVIKDIKNRPEAIWVNVKDFTSGYGDECAIYVEKNDTSLQIEIDDSLWWQGRWAMWTPAAVRESGIGESDIRIPRIGYSGVERPKYWRPEMRR